MKEQKQEKGSPVQPETNPEPEGRNPARIARAGIHEGEIPGAAVDRR